MQRIRFGLSIDSGAGAHFNAAVGAEPLDGTQVAVTRGLDRGDRVVTQGATLINQIR